MSRVKQFNGVWASVGLISAYFLLFFAVDYYHSKFIADLLALVGLSFMAASTTPVAIKAIRHGIRTELDKFLVSYWSIWAVFLAHRFWVIFLGLHNTPENALAYNFYREGPVSGLIAVLIGVAAFHGATAPFVVRSELKKRDLIIFSAAAGFSGIIAGIAIGVFIIAGWTN